MPASIHPDRIYLPLARKHALRHTDWLDGIYSDYWFMAGQDTITASTGFTLTSLTQTDGTAADLLTSADVGTPAHVGTDASADAFSTPAIFGDYSHGLAVARLLGFSPLRLPTKVVAEWYGVLETATANEPRSGWGFMEDNGTVGVQADQVAWIYSNASFFTLENGGGFGTQTSISTVAVDNNYHLFKIVLDSRLSVVRWFIDNNEVTVTPVGLETDEFPVYWSMHALTTNRPSFAWLHIFYDY